VEINYVSGITGHGTTLSVANLITGDIVLEICSKSGISMNIFMKWKTSVLGMFKP